MNPCLKAAEGKIKEGRILKTFRPREVQHVLWIDSQNMWLAPPIICCALVLYVLRILCTIAHIHIQARECNLFSFFLLDIQQQCNNQML